MSRPIFQAHVCPAFALPRPVRRKALFALRALLAAARHCPPKAVVARRFLPARALLAATALLLPYLTPAAHAKDSAAAAEPDLPLPAARLATPSGDKILQQVPPGSLFLYDIDGTVSVQKGGDLVPSPARQTLEADQPVRVTFGAEATVAMVFSNGAALWAKGPGAFTVRRFEQLPFQGNSRQNPYEPTSSTLEIDIERGTYAFAERQLSALSALRLRFGDGHVLDAHEAPSFLLEVGSDTQGNHDRVSVLNGRALLHYHGQKGSAVLLGRGQFLQLERNRSAGAQQLRLPEQLTSTQQELDLQQADRAQIANDRIWFVREPGSPTLSAQPAVPVNFWLGKPHAATRIR